MEDSVLSNEETLDSTLKVICGEESSPTLSTLVSTIKFDKKSNLPQKEGWLKKKSPQVLMG